MRTRDKDYWFEDGNIILVAGNVEFCIYIGPLVRSSPIFYDVLSLPQPEPDDGLCARPLIEITDHPNDIKCILGSVMFGNDLR